MTDSIRALRWEVRAKQVEPLVLLAALTAVGIGTWMLWHHENGLGALVVLAGAMLVLAADWQAPQALDDVHDEPAAPTATVDLVRSRLIFLCLAVALGAAVSVGVQVVRDQVSEWILAGVWAISMMCLVASTVAGAHWHVRRALFTWETGSIAAILAVAALVRTLPTGSDFPLHGDEGYHVGIAVQLASSPRPDLVSVDYLDLSHMYYAAWGLLFHITGSGVVGARLFPAFWGVVGVAATYLFARDLFGFRVGYLAALILAVDPVDVRYSRLAMGNSFAPALLPLTLFFLLRGLRYGRSRWWMAAGITSGIAQYGHTDARFLVLIVAVVLLYEVIREPAALWAQRWNIGLLGLCAVLAYNPTLSYVIHQPAALSARNTQLDILMNGWLAYYGQVEGLFPALTSQVTASLLPLFANSPLGDAFYPFGAMLIPAAVPFTLAGFLRLVVRISQRPAFLLISWMVMVFILGGVLVQPFFGSQHFLTLSAPLAICAALGVVWLAEFAAPHLRLALIGVLAVAIATNGIVYYFERYSPVPSQNPSYEYKDDVISEMGLYLRQVPKDTRIYFFDHPWLNYRAQPQGQWLSGRTDVIDVFPRARKIPLFEGADGAVFFFVPSRLRELPAIERRFPGGAVVHFSAPYLHGRVLLTAYLTPAAERLLVHT